MWRRRVPGQVGTILPPINTSLRHAIHRQSILASLALGLLLGTQGASAQAPELRIPPGAEASPTFDATRATDPYLATVPPDQKARTDAYVDGSDWLLLWNALYTSVALWALLTLGWSVRMKEVAQRITTRRPFQTALCWLQFVVYLWVVTFPLTSYSDFYREHQYGLATQTFRSWMGDQLIALGVVLALGTPALMALYGVLRRAGRSWWLWATGVVVAFLIVSVLIAPLFIAPLFNTYTPLDDARVREPILRMARANGISVDRVYVADESRQSTRISANVNGLWGTTRISLNDNLLKRASIEEIEAVIGHEMGHYVLNHVPLAILDMSLVMAIGFALIARAFESLRTRRPEWGITSSGDVARLPLLALLTVGYLFVVTPIVNTLTRTVEYEADVFGLNASRQPDGFASVALKLGEYRKLAPGPIEEFIFFDHPSGRTRIFTAMRWKAKNSPGLAPHD